jgi:hypothetical protein
LKRKVKTAGAVVAIQVSVEMKSDSKEKGQKKGAGVGAAWGGLLNLTIDNSQNFE